MALTSIGSTSQSCFTPELLDGGLPGRPLRPTTESQTSALASFALRVWCTEHVAPIAPILRT